MHCCNFLILNLVKLIYSSKTAGCKDQSSCLQCPSAVTQLILLSSCREARGCHRLAAHVYTLRGKVGYVLQHSCLADARVTYEKHVYVAPYMPPVREHLVGSPAEKLECQRLLHLVMPVYGRCNRAYNFLVEVGILREFNYRLLVFLAYVNLFKLFLNPLEMHGIEEFGVNRPGSLPPALAEWPYPQNSSYLNPLPGAYCIDQIVLHPHFNMACWGASPGKLQRLLSLGFLQVDEFRLLLIVLQT